MLPSRRLPSMPASRIRRTSRACSAARPARRRPSTGDGPDRVGSEPGTSAPLTLTAFKPAGRRIAHDARMKGPPLSWFTMACALACPVAAEAEQRMREPEPVSRLPVVVPFPECGSTALLPVRVNGHETRLFILDSGANSIALDDRFADSLGLRPAGTGAGSGAGAGPLPYRRYPRDSVEFEVAGVSFRSDHTISIDLSNQPGILGYSVAGVLGTDFFRLVTVEIDYDARFVRLHDPTRFSPPAGAETIPLTFEHEVPHVTARLTVPGLP